MSPTEVLDQLEFATYERVPFPIRAVMVTHDNIAHIASAIGELKEKKDGTPYIQVNPKVVPHFHRVFVGYYVTRVDEKIRCFSKKNFDQQFRVL